MNQHNGMDNLEQRLDQALDALNAEQAPLIFEDDAPELIELIDTARLVRRLRDPAQPDEEFLTHLAATLAAELTQANTSTTRLSENGRLRMIRSRRLHRLLWAAAALLRTLGIAALGGMLVALIVGGIGGRIVMRVSGYLYERQHPGSFAITESSGQPVGDVSLAGTLSLMMEVTLFFGVAGGLVYLLFQPWLPGRGWRRGLVVGVFFLLLLGSLSISSDNQDFRRLGSPLLNVVMFGMLIFGFGFFIGRTTDWLHRRIPSSLPRRPRDRRGLAGYVVVLTLGGLVLLTLLVTLVAGVVALATAPSGLLIVPIFVGALIIIVSVRLLVSATGAATAMHFGQRSAAIARWMPRRHVDTAISLLIGVLVLLGACLTLLNIYRILAGT